MRFFAKEKRAELEALCAAAGADPGWLPALEGLQGGATVPASLLERVDLVAPTWKPRGLVDYSWPPGPSPPVGAPEPHVDACVGVGLGRAERYWRSGNLEWTIG